MFRNHGIFDYYNINDDDPTILAKYPLISNADDSYGNHSMDTVGSISYVDGSIGGCLYTSNGNANYVYNSDLLVDYNFSVSFWLKFTSAAAYQAPFRLSLGTIYTNYSSIGTDASGAKLSVKYCRTGVRCYDNVVDMIVNDGNWHHVVMLQTPKTVNQSLWIDGVKYIDSWVSGLSANAINSNGWRFANEGFDGYLARAYLFSKLLSNEEVLQLYNGGTPF